MKPSSAESIIQNVRAAAKTFGPDLAIWTMPVGRMTAFYAYNPAGADDRQRIGTVAATGLIAITTALLGELNVIRGNAPAKSAISMDRERELLLEIHKLREELRRHKRKDLRISRKFDRRMEREQREYHAAGNAPFERREVSARR